MISPSLPTILREAGFAPAARLSSDGGVFKLDWLRQYERLGPCIYVYIDRGRVLYIGHGRTLRSRLADDSQGECGWLNGKRLKDNGKPIQLQWLETFKAIFAEVRTIEIWAKAAGADAVTREREEHSLITAWNPFLNTWVLIDGRRTKRCEPRALAPPID